MREHREVARETNGNCRKEDMDRNSKAELNTGKLECTQSKHVRLILL